MVEIIENEQDAGGAERIRFRPYRSTRRPGVILASWKYAPEPADPKGPALILENKLGTPAVIELPNAMIAAYQYSVRFVWIDDPDGLFPPPDRPSFQIVP